jgi:hypothetical protein
VEGYSQGGAPPSKARLVGARAVARKSCAAVDHFRHGMTMPYELRFISRASILNEGIIAESLSHLTRLDER